MEYLIKTFFIRCKWLFVTQYQSIPSGLQSLIHCSQHNPFWIARMKGKKQLLQRGKSSDNFAPYMIFSFCSIDNCIKKEWLCFTRFVFMLRECGARWLGGSSDDWPLHWVFDGEVTTRVSSLSATSRSIGSDHLHSY